MKTCLICEIETPEENDEVCETCLEFFKSKYTNGLKEELELFRKNRDRLKKWRLTERRNKDK